MTIERIILIIIAAGGVASMAAAVACRMLAAKVGDCAIEWANSYLQVEPPDYLSEWEATIKFAVPIKSVGKQQCILIDMIGRLHPEGDKYLEIDNNVFVYAGGNRRKDRYWEAALVKPGDTLIIKGELTLSSQDMPIKEALRELGCIYVDLYHKYYCRNRLAYARKVVNLDLSEFPGLEQPSSYRDRFVTVDQGQDVLPIRTPLLVPGDSIYGVFEKYVKQHVKEGDVLAVCESALAIMEGRVYYVEDIRPGILATHLNKLFKTDSSLSSPYSMEMAIREVGAAKIITSVIVGALGKLVGRDGDFYAFAGRAVATIDDCTGTLPPFDKYVVMGPKDPKKSACEFMQKTGVDLAVVDVNDLGKVDILGMSDPSTKERIAESLKTNPQGNANEQTPIALIRKADDGRRRAEGGGRMTEGG